MIGFHLHMWWGQISLIALEGELTSSELLQNSHSSEGGRNWTNCLSDLRSIPKHFGEMFLSPSAPYVTLHIDSGLQVLTVKHLSHPQKTNGTYSEQVTFQHVDPCHSQHGGPVGRELTYQGGSWVIPFATRPRHLKSRSHTVIWTFLDGYHYLGQLHFHRYRVLLLFVRIMPEFAAGLRA